MFLTSVYLGLPRRNLQLIYPYTSYSDFDVFIKSANPIMSWENIFVGFDYTYNLPYVLFLGERHKIRGTTLMSWSYHLFDPDITTTPKIM